MNEVQLQKDILSRILKGKSYQLNYYKDYERDLIWVCIEGLRIYQFELRNFYIDLERAGCREFKEIKRILDNSIEGQYCKITNEVRIDGKNSYIKLANEGYNIETWINKDFLKPFKDISKLAFRVKNSKSLIYIYEDDYLIAVACPIIVK